MKHFSRMLVLLLAIAAVPAGAQTNAWQWHSELVPKARVFEGYWSRYYKIEPALHRAGLPYSTALMGYLEAAWFGVPALAGRDGGAADAVLDGETGLVCDGANQDEVDGSLLSLLGDAALRKRLGIAAQERVKRELTWSVAIQRFLETFTKRADFAPG